MPNPMTARSDIPALYLNPKLPEKTYTVEVKRLAWAGLGEQIKLRLTPAQEKAFIDGGTLSVYVPPPTQKSEPTADPATTEEGKANG